MFCLVSLLVGDPSLNIFVGLSWNGRSVASHGLMVEVWVTYFFIFIFYF